MYYYYYFLKSNVLHHSLLGKVILLQTCIIFVMYWTEHCITSVYECFFFCSSKWEGHRAEGGWEEKIFKKFKHITYEWIQVDLRQLDSKYFVQSSADRASQKYRPYSLQSFLSAIIYRFNYSDLGKALKIENWKAMAKSFSSLELQRFVLKMYLPFLWKL